MSLQLGFKLGFYRWWNCPQYCLFSHGDLTEIYSIPTGHCKLCQPFLPHLTTAYIGGSTSYSCCAIVIMTVKMKEVQYRNVLMWLAVIGQPSSNFYIPILYLCLFHEMCCDATSLEKAATAMHNYLVSNGYLREHLVMNPREKIEFPRCCNCHFPMLYLQ